MAEWAWSEWMRFPTTFFICRSSRLLPRPLIPLLHLLTVCLHSISASVISYFLVLSCRQCIWRIKLQRWLHDRIEGCLEEASPQTSYLQYVNASSLSFPVASDISADQPVMVTHIVDPSEFYVLEQKDFEKMVQLTRTITTTCNQTIANAIPSNVSVGQHILANLFHLFHHIISQVKFFWQSLSLIRIGTEHVWSTCFLIRWLRSIISTTEIPTLYPWSSALSHYVCNWKYAMCFVFYLVYEISLRSLAKFRVVCIAVRWLGSDRGGRCVQIPFIFLS